MLRCREGVQSEEVCKLKTGKDAAYRLAMHPAGRSLVLGMSVGGLERVDVTPSSSGEAPTLTLSQGAFKEATAGIGPVKSMSFSSDGRLLALGGEDGSIDLWEWPHMTRRLRYKPGGGLWAPLWAGQRTSRPRVLRPALLCACCPAAFLRSPLASASPTPLLQTTAQVAGQRQGDPEPGL